MTSAVRPGQPARVPGWWPGMLRAWALTLRRPGLWPIALAGFLARGGIVLLALPIVVLPTATGVASVVSQDVVSIALGGPGPGTVRLIAAAAAGFGGWLVVGWLAGAAMDVALVRAVAAAEDAAGAPAHSPAPWGGWRTVLRAWAVRLLAHAPLVVALALSVPPTVATTYHELILPDDLVTPIAIRVLRAVPGELAAVLVVWLVGETLGGLAVRRVVLDGRGVWRAAGESLVFVVRGAIGSAATTLVGLVAAVVPLAALLGAATLAWGRLRFALSAGAPAQEIAARIVLSVVLFGAALAAAGFAAALRGALWTVEARRRGPIVRPAPTR